MDMFTLDVDSEEIICKIKARKPVGNWDVAQNFLQNMMTRAGGDIADMVTLILTRDKLVIQYRGHASIGWAEETRRIDEYQLADVDAFRVEKMEKEEKVIFSVKGKEMVFIRDNERGDDLASELEKELNHIRLGYF